MKNLAEVTNQVRPTVFKATPLTEGIVLIPVYLVPILHPGAHLACDFFYSNPATSLDPFTQYIAHELTLQDY